MLNVRAKSVLVAGLGLEGQAACRLLREHGVRVVALGAAGAGEQDDLRAIGVDLRPNVETVDDEGFDFAVAQDGDDNVPWQMALSRLGIPVISDLELTFRESRCLNITVAGTNGKSTTAELIAGILRHSGRKVVIGGIDATPLCDLVPQSRELDFLVLKATARRLDRTQYFRPAIAVLMNIMPEQASRYSSGHADYIRATAKLFFNQQPFDWAVVQSEALAQMRAMSLPIPAKVITFSAVNRRADLTLDRSLLVSRLADWEGPLIDMDKCQLRGPHNAENLMAALAVGRILRVPLEQMVATLSGQPPIAHCCEPVAMVNGVSFVNDAKAINIDALRSAIQAIPPGRGGEPNVWLISGGHDCSPDAHDLGPLLSQRVKRAFLVGRGAEKLRAAWSLFTPCALTTSLLEAVSQAAGAAISGDTVLFSPACLGSEMSQTYQHRGEVYRDAVASLARSMGCVDSEKATTLGADAGQENSLFATE